MISIAVLTTIIICDVVMTGHNSNEQKSETIPAGPATRGSQAVSSSSPTIPQDVAYRIEATRIIPGIKRDLDIRLNRKVTTDALRVIAIKLKNSDPHDYERTLITYWLPNMKIGAEMAWATTNFDPDLKVSILGFVSDASVQENSRKLSQMPSFSYGVLADKERLCRALDRQGFKLGETTGGKTWAVNQIGAGFCDIADLDLIVKPPGVTAISYIVQGSATRPNEILLELTCYHRYALRTVKAKYLSILNVLFNTLEIPLPKGGTCQQV